MSDQQFWNERYADSDYFYGTEPNSFLEEQCGILNGPVLSISEGEGRNGVFLATRGLDVTGVDLSSVALEKAEKLAESKGVTITTIVADLETFEPEESHYGSIISISAHLPSSLRAVLYPRLEKALKPGGILLLEAYSPDQLSKGTGGPKDADMLMSVEKIRKEFPDLEPVLLRETEREVSEGKGHTGLASVVQFIGRKSQNRER